MYNLQMEWQPKGSVYNHSQFDLVSIDVVRFRVFEMPKLVAQVLQQQCFLTNLCCTSWLRLLIRVV